MMRFYHIVFVFIEFQHFSIFNSFPDLDIKDYQHDKDIRGRYTRLHTYNTKFMRDSAENRTKF